MNHVTASGQDDIVPKVTLEQVPDLVWRLYGLQEILTAEIMNHGNDATASDQDDIVPKVALEQIPDLVWRLYGLQTENVERLPSHYDVNVYFRARRQVDNGHISDVCTDGYVLKVMNSRTSQDPRCIEAMFSVMRCVRNGGVGTPDIVINKSGKDYCVETITGHNNHGTMGPYIVRLLTFIPGQVFLNTPHVAGSFRNIGEMVGKLHQAVKDFHHPYYDTYRTIRNLVEFSALRDLLPAVHEDTDRHLIEEVIDTFENTVKPEFPNFRKSIIHGDLSHVNTVMHKVPVTAGETDTGVHDVTGLIDFDDACQSYAVMEVATIMAYISIECPLETQLDAGGHLLSGYYKHSSLNEAEKRCLKILVCARLCQSLVFSVHAYLQHPGNEYLLTTAKRGWPLLHRLWGTNEAELYSRWDEIVRASNSM